MARRLRHHVNPLGLAFVGRQARRLELPADVAVEVELGCADARFLFERAAEHTATLFIGLEIRRPLVQQVNRIAHARSRHNLHARFAHINVELDDLFADGRLSRVFLNFPDPWFKRRHQKRRLLTPELALALHRKLRGGGELFFQSDVFAVALDAMYLLETAPCGFRNLEGAWCFARANPYGARSRREVQCEERGARIWRIRYQRPGAAGGLDSP